MSDAWRVCFFIFMVKFFIISLYYENVILLLLSFLFTICVVKFIIFFIRLVAQVIGELEATSWKSLLLQLVFFFHDEILRIF